MKVHSHLVETPVHEQVSLHDEVVKVDRRAVDQAVDADDALFQDRTIVLEEFTEKAVVSKEVRVVEEISPRREARDRTETIRDTVRHTEVEIEDTRTASDLGGKRDVREGSDDGRIVERMEVYASDGTRVGTVDHVKGSDRFKLASSTSPDGQHHDVPMSWVDHVDRHVHLDKTVAEVAPRNLHHVHGHDRRLQPPPQKLHAETARGKGRSASITFEKPLDWCC